MRQNVPPDEAAPNVSWFESGTSQGLSRQVEPPKLFRHNPPKSDTEPETKLLET